MDGHGAVVIYATNVVVDGEVFTLFSGLLHVNVIDEFLVGRVDHSVVIRHIVDVRQDLVFQGLNILVLVHAVRQCTVGCEGSLHGCLLSHECCSTSRACFQCIRDGIEIELAQHRIARESTLGGSCHPVVIGGHQ